MSSEHPGKQPEDLQSIIASFLAAERVGEPPDRDAMLAEHPKLADELRAFFAKHDLEATVDAKAQPTPADMPTETSPWGGSLEKAPAVGDTVNYFGDYELLEEIARGGMGVVYKARQTSLSRIVALKMILSGSLAGDQEVRRFKSEAEAAARLDHPGIVPIFEIGEHSGQHYFSMGFVEGRSLADRLRAGPLPPREAAELLVKIFEAVQYAHNKGVVHRDLKPGNVLIDGSGSPRVSDFGLAKQLDSDSEMTKTGQVLGTPAYMPPEQASGKVKEVGPLSDVYALGAMFYAMLTGRPPFQAATTVDTLRQVIEQAPVPLRRLNTRIPKDLETICLKCLEKEPERRYRSADSLGLDLQRYLRGEPINARPVSVVERTWRWCKRHPVPTGLSSLVALLFVALVVGSLITRRTRQLGLAASGVNAVSNSRGVATRFLIEDLEQLPSSMVREELLRQLNSAQDTQKLPLTFALADYRNVRTEFLVEQVAQALPEEFDNFVEAFSVSTREALRVIKSAAEAYDTKAEESNTEVSDPESTDRDYSALRYKARLAMLSLRLGDSSLAAEMCRVRPDPNQRTLFVDECQTWHGDLIQLGEVARSVDHAELRSVLCMIVGSVSPNEVTQKQKEMWQSILADWHVSQPDAGTHSASGWALRQWRLPLPTLPVGDPKRSKDFDQEIAELLEDITNLKTQHAEAQVVLQKELLADSESSRVALLQECLEGSLSPSGELVVFVRPPDEKEYRRSLVQRDLRNSTEDVLHEDGAYPVISPLQSKLIALCIRGESSFLDSVALLSSEEKSIRLLGSGYYPTWSLDGTKVYFSDFNARAVVSVDITQSATTPQKLMKMPAENTRDTDIANVIPFLIKYSVSPDGRKIANAVNEVVHLREPKTGELIAEYSAPRWIVMFCAWSSDSRYLAVAGFSLGSLAFHEESGVRVPSDDYGPIDKGGIMVVDTMKGSSFVAISGTVETPQWAGWSPDGSRILYGGDKSEMHIEEWSPQRELHLADANKQLKSVSQRLIAAKSRLTDRVESERQWRVNSVGLTMLQVNAGTVHHLTQLSVTEVQSGFLLSDREISIGLFKKFLDDPECPDEEKPKSRSKYQVSAQGSTAEHPVSNITWFDAVQFCNWLSRREGRQPSYKHIANTEVASSTRLGAQMSAIIRTSLGLSEDSRSAEVVWQFDGSADGYRLPTSAEWVLACRAKSNTLFSFGNDEEMLETYGVFSSGRLYACASKLPNQLGLFDMHGNVREWCNDSPYGNNRAIAGGDFWSSAADCMSDAITNEVADGIGATIPSVVRGFRVARTLHHGSSQEEKASSESEFVEADPEPAD